MKSMINIPKGLTHGEDLVVIRKSEYETLRRQFKELKDALEKIRRGEKELRNGKTKKVNSLEGLR